MNRPDNMLTYNEMDLKLGIKSSIPHVKSVIGLAILLWECSDHPAQLDYSVQKGNEISLNDALADRIKKYMTEVFDDTRITEDGLISRINQNQLFKSQMEALIVAFELVWKIAIVEFIDNTKAASAERTGGIRFPKRLNYSVNIDIIHSVIDGNKEKYLHVLLNWIGFDIDFDPDFETTLINLLTALSETAVFKLSDGDKDVIFNQNSIYMKLLETSEKVDINGDKEAKGSLRILKSLLSDGMNSYLDYSSGLVSYFDSDRDSLESYQKRVDTYLKLCAAKAIETNNDDISTDILNHNLFGIHIKEQNDALSDSRPHICIGWSDLGDLSDIESKDELVARYVSVWPNAKPKSQGQNIGQVWRFKNDMQIGDYVIFADENLLHIGRVESDYYYDDTVYSTQNPDYKNSRNVLWLKKNIQRTEVSEAFQRVLRTGMSLWMMNDYRAAIADLISGIYVKDEDEDYEESDEQSYYSNYSSSKPRNRIVFGAPGTGKSFMLNKERKELLGENNELDYERVTFHPDYSYANFVGTYKPVMVVHNNTADDPDINYVVSILNDKGKSAQEKYDVLFERFKDEGLTRLPVLLGLYTDEFFKTKKQDGSDAVGDNSVERNHGKAIRKYVQLLTGQETTSDIAYEYVPGPFMRIYVKALRSLRSGNPKPYLLIIEEINRSNVAAVFGDIFQLLDRGDDAVSEYPIAASEDIKAYLAKELGGNPENYAKIRIPDNMFIWATMNSADQGVFPMDTAFKRRWDFTYIGINHNMEEIDDYVFELPNGKRINWNKLRRAINSRLASLKINEDKLLGPFFISEKVLKAGDDAFVNAFESKVLMYIFEDAGKQRRTDIFRDDQKSDGDVLLYSVICENFRKKGTDIFCDEIKNAAPYEVPVIGTNIDNQDTLEKNENDAEKQEVAENE